jgi:biopolymer transport protein ExbB
MNPPLLANLVVDTFLHGGLLMWPLLVLSLVALGIVTERVASRIVAQRQRDSDRLTRTYAALSRGDQAAAVALARASADPRLRVIAHGLLHPEAGIEIAMEIRAVDELKLARRFLTALDTIITLAPLLGLLGTVTGIMQSFKFVGGDQELAVGKVSGGIGEALIATASGLGIAIFTLVPFNLFGSYAEELHEDLETVIKNVRLLVEKARPGERARAPESAVAD